MGGRSQQLQWNPVRFRQVPETRGKNERQDPLVIRTLIHPQKTRTRSQKTPKEHTLKAPSVRFYFAGPKDTKHMGSSNHRNTAQSTHIASVISELLETHRAAMLGSLLRVKTGIIFDRSCPQTSAQFVRLLVVIGLCFAIATVHTAYTRMAIDWKTGCISCAKQHSFSRAMTSSELTHVCSSLWRSLGQSRTASVAEILPGAFVTTVSPGLVLRCQTEGRARERERQRARERERQRARERERESEREREQEREREISLPTKILCTKRLAEPGEGCPQQVRRWLLVQHAVDELHTPLIIREIAPQYR